MLIVDMTAAIGTLATSFVIVAVAAGGGVETGTCRKLDALYEANIDAVAGSLRAYQRCLAATARREACAAELAALETAQEIIQAAFADYLKACGSTVAARPGSAVWPGRRLTSRRHPPPAEPSTAAIARLVAGGGHRQDAGPNFIEKGWRRWPMKA